MEVQVKNNGLKVSEDKKKVIPDDAANSKPIKKRTRRGIALCSPQKSRRSTEDISIPIYTSRLDYFREGKKKINAAALALEFSPIKQNCTSSGDEEENKQKVNKVDAPRTLRSRKKIVFDVDVDDIQAPLSPPKYCPSEVNIKHSKNCMELIQKLENARNKFSHDLLHEESALNQSLLRMEEIDDCLLVDNNREYLLKLRWRRKVEKIAVKNNQPFHLIIGKLSEIIKEPINKLILTFNDDVIKPNDTPGKLGITVSDIIDCGLLSSETAPVEQEKDSDTLSLKLQAKDMKNKIILTMRKSDPMSILIEKFAQKREISPTKIILQFDGDDLDNESTAEELDIENDYCIDVIIRK